MTAEVMFSILGKMSPETRSQLEVRVRAGSGEVKDVIGLQSTCDLKPDGSEVHSLIIGIRASHGGPRGPRAAKEGTGTVPAPKPEAPKAASPTPATRAAAPA